LYFIFEHFVFFVKIGKEENVFFKSKSIKTYFSIILLNYKSFLEKKIMLAKEDVLKYIKEMPDHFSIEDLMDKLLFLHKIEMGLEQSKNNQVISHQKVKNQLKKWLK